MICFSILFFVEEVLVASSLFKFLLLVLMAGESVLVSSAFLAILETLLLIDFVFSAVFFSLVDSAFFAESAFS